MDLIYLGQHSVRCWNFGTWIRNPWEVLKWDVGES